VLLWGLEHWRLRSYMIYLRRRLPQSDEKLSSEQLRKTREARGEGNYVYCHAAYGTANITGASRKEH